MYVRQDVHHRHASRETLPRRGKNRCRRATPRRAVPCRCQRRRAAASRPVRRRHPRSVLASLTLGHELRRAALCFSSGSRKSLLLLSSLSSSLSSLLSSSSLLHTMTRRVVCVESAHARTRNATRDRTGWRNATTAVISLYRERGTTRARERGRTESGTRLVPGWVFSG